MGHEREQDAWLRTTLRHGHASTSDGCLDAETLAAWAEHGLTAQASAAVELHASNCARCTAVLAAMERTAPAGAARQAWSSARLFRWLVPLTAAATAVAIWIAVPDRPNTNERVSVPVAVPGSVPAPEPRTVNQDPAPSTPNPEPQFAREAAAKSAPQESLRARDDLRLERAVPETLGATAGAEASAKAPSAAPSAPAAARVAAPSPVSTDALAETAAPAQRLAFNKMGETVESAASSNPLVRWRVTRLTSIERSTDGGRTWTVTTSPPGVAPNIAPALSVVTIRAVDGDRAVVRTSDNAEFYTVNGGLSWTRVQETSAAPF